MMASDFECILHHIPDALLVVNKSGCVVWCNECAVNLTGYADHELLGSEIELLVPESFHNAHQKLRNTFMENPGRRPMGYTRHLSVVAKSGKQVAVDIELSPVDWEGSRAVMVVVRPIMLMSEQHRALQDTRNLLSASQSLANIGTWDWDIKHQTMEWSSQLYEILEERMDGRPRSIDEYLKFVHPNERELLRESINDALVFCTQFRLQHRLILASGLQKHVLECGRVYSDSSGEVHRVIATVQDITQEFNQQVRVKLAESLFQYSSEGVLSADQNFVIVDANPAFFRITATPTEDICGSPVRDLLPGFCSRNAIEQIKSKGQWSGELLCVTSDHQRKPVLVSVSPVERRLEHSEIEFVVTIIDISAVKENESVLMNLAYHDQLTRLSNRTQFIKALHQKIRSAESVPQRFAVLLIDIDGFKEVNDSQGHPEGDRLLIEISQRLKRMFSEDTLVARMGGDEFSVLLPCDSLDTVTQSASQVVESLCFIKKYQRCSFSISASVGVAHYPSDGAEVSELMKNADIAMYQSKFRGKNCFTIYDSAFGKAKEDRIGLISDIDEALGRDEFVVYFQKKICLTGSNVTHLEALLRWKHPDKGIIRPLDFIPVAEETNQIVEIGEQVVERVCEFISQWKGINRASVKVAVNLSARQIADIESIRRIITIIDRYHIDASALEFEITESVIMQDVDAARMVLNMLKAMGSTIAVDDFGTGYSSLSYLATLPVDTIKIDRVFVRNIPDSKVDCSICKAVVSMAKNLEMQVVAEGVETPSQRDYLKRIGCDQLQGHLFGHPEPTHILLERVNEIEGNAINN